MSSTTSVTVIGLGYVGLPTAALLADAGFDVLGVDIDERLLVSLQDGRGLHLEAEVQTLVDRGLASGKLKLSETPRENDVVIICVPSPVLPDKRPDYAAIDAAMRSVVRHLRKGNLVILESTSPIGTITDVVAPILREGGFDPEVDIDLCYCPERVFPGYTIREMKRNSRVVGGLTPQAAERAATIYRSFCSGEIVTTTAASAEFAKLMENTFRDVNIALANVFARIAEEAGIDVLDTIRIANQHPRVNVHAPGAGVGGHCIPVDPWFLVSDFPNASELLRMSRQINDAQPQRLLERAEQAGLPAKARVAILGVAYRGNIDDARESPAERLVEALGLRGYRWTVHDPCVSRWETHAGNIPVESDLSEALSQVSAAFIMTDHDAYRRLAPGDFEGMEGRVIADGRRVLPVSEFAAAGFTIVPVGAPTAFAAGRPLA